MRKDDIPFLPDWVVISLRWLVLVALALTQAATRQPPWLFLVIIGGAAGWNILLSFLALLNVRLPGHRMVNFWVDLLLAAGLFYASGGLTGAVTWAGVLVLLSAAMYYEWRGALAAAVLVTAAEIGLLAAVDGIRDMDLLRLPVAILAGINFGAGSVFGLLSMRVMRALRRLYGRLLAERQETERKARIKERHRLQTFYSMVETLSGTLNYQVVLESVLNLSATALDEDSQTTHLISAVMLFEESELTIGAARGFSPTDLRRRFPAEKGGLAEALQAGRPVQVHDLTRDEELGQVYVLQGFKSGLVLPLLRGLNAYGVMLFGHPESGFFNEERRDLLEMISHQVVIAIQNARLFQDLELEKNRLVESQEEARKKLARDLHDGPTQSVSAIAMRISIARRLLEQSPREVPGELERIEDLARRTTQEIRHMLFTLRPLALESEGLISALQQMSDKMRETFQQNVSLDIDPTTVKALDNGKQTVVFYLVEEAVNNARKHAQASEIRARLKFFTQDQSMALLEIVDNGKGFDVASVSASYEKRGSLGMVNLQERAELINAALNIQSVPGKGTRVQVLIPLTEAALDRLQRGLVAAKANVN